MRHYSSILEDHGLAAIGLHFALKENYNPRDFCVQYQESDWDFISRLMEEEGIYHYYRECDGVATLHITDGPHGHFDVQFGREARYHAPEGLTPEPGTIFEFASRRQIRPGRIAQVDYAAVKPSMPLDTQAEDAGNGLEKNLEVFEFPGEYRDRQLGQRLAKVRLEGLRTGHVHGRGRSTRVDFGPGHRFTLEHHPVGRLNAEYVLTTVRHRGHTPMAVQIGYTGNGQQVRPAYENEYVVIPAHQVFRPARTTPRARVAGPQTAVVVGPEKEEIYTDKHGRVKVRFRCDREEQLGRDGRKRSDSSCWIRVSQPWAGAGYGGLTIPRIGQEVIVDFLEGDPDQPIITGRVYNGEEMQPQALPASQMPAPKGAKKAIAEMLNRATKLPEAKTRTAFKSNSTPGGGGANEITVDDDAGKELLFINATKDAVRTVGNNDRTSVGKDREIAVGNNLDEFVAVNRSRRVGADETVKVDVNQDVTVDANRSITVKGNESHTVHMCRAKQVMISENILTGVSKTVETGLAHIETVGLLHTLLVGMQRLTAVGMNDDLIVGADKCDKIYGNYTTNVDNEMGISVGTKMVIECPDITLKAGANFIRIFSGGIAIKGKPVRINCDDAKPGELSGTSTAAGGGGGTNGAGTLGTSRAGAGILPGGCTPSLPTQGGLGGLLDALGLGGFDGLLTKLGIDPKGPLGQVLGAIGQILPKIPGIDSNISSLLNTLLNNGVPSMEQIYNAVRNRLPEDAQKALDAIMQAIREGTKPPPLPGRPTNPALPRSQGIATGNGTTSNFGPDASGGATGSGAGASSVGSNAAATFDAAAAASHATANAESAPTGMCGQYVREAIAAGGVQVQPTGSAMNYGPNLEAAGFQSVSATEGSYVPQQGDVVVFQATEGHPHGHIQIYNGSQFVSDFIQNDPLWPSSNPNSSWQQNKPSFTVYRYPAS